MEVVRAILEMGRGLSYEERKEVIAELLGDIDLTKPTGAKLCDAIMRVWATVAFEARGYPRQRRYPRGLSAPARQLRHCLSWRVARTRIALSSRRA